MIDLMAKWKPSKWAEEGGQIIKGVGPFLQKRMRERKVYRVREQYTSSRDKETRASSIAGMMQMGRVKFPAKADWVADLQWELARFPTGTFDDQVDTLSLIGRMLNDMYPGKGERIIEEPPIEEVGWTVKEVVSRRIAKRKGRRLSKEAPVLPVRTFNNMVA